MTEAATIAQPSVGSEYARLKREVQSAGLLDRSGVRALPRVMVVGFLLAAGIAGLVVLRNSWWDLAIAAFLAAAVAQVGFLAHDAGHQQIFRSRRCNDRFGRVVANAFGGLSYNWWVDKHNRHHRSPNDVESDPDVSRNIMAWTDAQASEQRGIARMIARHQAVFFVPLLLLEALNLQVSSVLRLADRRRHCTVEAVLLAVHAIGGVALLLCFMTPLHAVAFIGVQQGLLGLYLGASFAPNHKGMPMSDGATTDFLRRQVLASRNMRGGRVFSAAFGGLNYQIEHHLFPSMPSRNLARARPIVKRFCAEQSIAYHETSPLESYRLVFRYLASITPTT